MPQAKGISIALLMKSLGARSRSSLSATSYIGLSQLGSSRLRAPRTMRLTVIVPRSSQPSTSALTPPQPRRSIVESDMVERRDEAETTSGAGASIDAGAATVGLAEGD